MSTSGLRRISAGSYETRDGLWKIDFHPAQNGHYAIWTMYKVADPNAADSYASLADVRAAIQHERDTATITREFDRWSYPRNGNLNNPTPTWRWVPRIAGEIVSGGDRTLAEAKAFLADYFGATNVTVIRNPLPANPYSRKFAESL